jgi:hypothetical protein
MEEQQSAITLADHMRIIKEVDRGTKTSHHRTSRAKDFYHRALSSKAKRAKKARRRLRKRHR